MSNRRNKKVEKYITSLIIFIIISICAWYFNETNIGKNILVSTNGMTNNTIENLVSNSTFVSSSQVLDNIDINNDKLNVLFLYVGQADCTLIKFNDKTMLIDAGNNEDGKNVANYIQSLGINEINYLIGTHSDEDHIGGIDDVINNIKIDNFYIPKVGTTETDYKNAISAANNTNLKVTNPSKGDSFNISNAKCEIMACMNYDGISDNNSSIVIQMNYNNNTFLFMGDAEKEVESSREWNKVDVLKVGHHGSSTGSTADFLKQVSPHYAVIEVGKNNSYRLPNTKTISRIEDTKAIILRTDTNCSSFFMTSDGNEITEAEVKVNLDGNK